MLQHHGAPHSSPETAKGRHNGSISAYVGITVRANWRIVFRFKDGQACDVDLVDYH
jgi:plasmid maintenance system killer protein